MKGGTGGGQGAEAKAGKIAVFILDKIQERQLGETVCGAI